MKLLNERKRLMFLLAIILIFCGCASSQQQVENSNNMEAEQSEFQNSFSNDSGQASGDQAINSASLNSETANEFSGSAVQGESSDVNFDLALAEPNSTGQVSSDFFEATPTGDTTASNISSNLGNSFAGENAQNNFSQPEQPQGSGTASAMPEDSMAAYNASGATQPISQGQQYQTEQQNTTAGAGNSQGQYIVQGQENGVINAEEAQGGEQSDDLSHRVFRNRETAEVVPPIRAMLWWVGYSFEKDDGYVRVEIVTRGDPKFTVLQEVNKSGQPELLIRFYETAVRSKVKRDIDASEFRSPVSYIRVRSEPLDGLTDVLITLRDGIHPRLYAKQGNVLLTFDIPERYYGNMAMGEGPVDQASVLPIEDIRPIIAAGSDLPEQIDLAAKYHYPDHTAGQFKEAPQNGGQQLAAIPSSDPPQVISPDSGKLSEVPEGQAPSQAMVNRADSELIQSESTSTEDLLRQNSATAGTGYINATGSNVVSGRGEGVNTSANGLQQTGVSASEVSASDAFAPSQASEISNFSSSNGFGGSFGEYSEGGMDKGELREYKSDGPQESSEFEGNDGFEEGVDDFDDIKFDDSDFDVRLKKLDLEIDSIISSHAVAQGTGEFDEVSDVENFALENTATDPTEFTDTAGAVAGTNLYTDPQAAVIEGTSTAPVNGADLNPTLESTAMPAASTADFGMQQTSPAAQEASPVLESSAEASYAESSAQGTYKPQSPSDRAISVSFADAPLDHVLDVILEESKISYLLAPDLKGTGVTIEFFDVSWTNALKILMDAYGLGFIEYTPNLVRIDTLENLDNEKKRLESIRKSTIAIASAKTVMHRMSYAKAEDIKAKIEKLVDPEKDGQVKIETEDRTNTLIIKGYEKTVAMLLEIVKRVDLPTPQVEIASRVIQVEDTESFRFGINWGFPVTMDAGSGLSFGTLTFPNQVNGEFAVDAGAQNDFFGTNLRFGSLNNSFELDVALSLGKERGEVEILNTNNVKVQDNTEASIISGTEDFVPVRVVEEGVARIVLETIEYVLQLVVTPQVTNDGMVNMTFELMSTEPGATSNAQATGARSRTEIKSVYRNKSGSTTVIGGLHSIRKSTSMSGVPFFSDIPIIGALFKRKSLRKIKKEILLLITPTILSSGNTYDQQEGFESTGGFDNLSYNAAIPQQADSAAYTSSQQGAQQSGTQSASQSGSNAYGNSEQSAYGSNSVNASEVSGAGSQQSSPYGSQSGNQSNAYGSDNTSSDPYADAAALSSQESSPYGNSGSSQQSSPGNSQQSAGGSSQSSASDSGDDYASSEDTGDFSLDESGDNESAEETDSADESSASSSEDFDI